MQCLSEALSTPILDSYDVVVAGGGPAGVAAALADHRVLLIEQYGFLGGMWTMGMVNPLFDYENKGGICRELVERIEQAGMGVQNGPDIWNFDIETMKRVLDEMMQEAGMTPLLHTQCVRPIVRDGGVQGVIVENKGGRGAY